MMVVVVIVCRLVRVSKRTVVVAVTFLSPAGHGPVEGGPEHFHAADAAAAVAAGMDDDRGPN